MNNLLTRLENIKYDILQRFPKVNLKIVEYKLNNMKRFFDSMPKSVTVWIIPDNEKGDISYWNQLLSDLHQKIINDNSVNKDPQQIDKMLTEFITDFNTTMFRFTTEFLRSGRSKKSSKLDVADIHTRLDTLINIRDWRIKNCSLYVDMCPLKAELELDTMATLYTIFCLAKYQKSNSTKYLLQFIVEERYKKRQKIETVDEWLQFDKYVIRANKLVDSIRLIKKKELIEDATKLNTDFRHFVKDIFAFLSKEDKLFSKELIDIFTNSNKQIDLDNVENAMNDMITYSIFLCMNFKKDYTDMGWFCTHGVGAKQKLQPPFIKRLLVDHQSLNSLWDKNCPNNAETLFCHAGLGEKLSLLIMSMRFVPITGSPRNHILYKGLQDLNNNIDNLTKNQNVRTLLKWGIAKIIKAYDLVLNKGGKYLSFKDMDKIASGLFVANKFTDFFDKLSRVYGLSIEPNKTNKPDQTKTQIDPTSVKSIKSIRSVDLDKIAKERCDSSWNNSLLCHMYYFSDFATLIGNLHFVVPDDNSKHIIKTVINNVKQEIEKIRISGVPKVLEKPAKLLIEKSIDTVLKNITTKIDKNEPISWSDINDLYETVMSIPILKDKITESINKTMATKGIAFNFDNI